jgi:hypothetical protein
MEIEFLFWRMMGGEEEMNEVQWWHLEMFSTPVLIQVLHDAFSLGFFFFCSLAFCFDTDTSYLWQDCHVFAE